MGDHSVRYARAGEYLPFHYGERVLWEKVPDTIRVLYPPMPKAGLDNVPKALERAVERPVGCYPLSAQLKPGMRVTICFPDLSVPMPCCCLPDVRQPLLEALVEKLTTAGITDLQLIAATGLNRRLTAAELSRVVGPKIFDSFYPDRLRSHDAEDPDSVYLGKTDEGEIVELNHRVGTSDLLLYLGLNYAGFGGGYRPILTGLATYRSARFHHNPECLLRSDSHVRAPESVVGQIVRRMGRLASNNVNIFKIEVSLGTPKLHSWLDLPRRSSVMSVPDQLRFHGERKLLDLLPRSIARRFQSGLCGKYPVTSIRAGKPEALLTAEAEPDVEDDVVPVEGQADVLLLGLPSVGPFNLGSCMNPVLVHNLAAGYVFGLHTGIPLVRRGGVMIVTHPLEKRFDQVEHPSYVGFYERVLADTRDPFVMHRWHEEEFAEDERYLEAYREGQAYHPVHPFLAWYWGVFATEYLSRVIVVKPVDRAVAQRLDWYPAASLAEGFAAAKSILNRTNISTIYFRCPPLFVADVQA